MNNSGQSKEKYQERISQIIERSLIDLYGINGYKSIIQTMIKECGKSEKKLLKIMNSFPA